MATTKKTTANKETKSKKATIEAKVSKPGIKAAVAKAPKKITRKPKVEVIEDFAQESFNGSSVFNKVREFLMGRNLNILIAVLLIGGGLYWLSKYMVVAWVDNKPVTRLEYYNALDQKYGKDVKEQIIVERLILDEATQKGIVISDQELSDEIKKVEDEQGGADKLNQILQIQNISREEFEKLIKLQTIKQRIFSDGVNVTDEDINKYLEENKEQFAQSEVDEKMKGEIKEQLKQQKVNTGFNDWLKSSLQGSRVVRL